MDKSVDNFDPYEYSRQAKYAILMYTEGSVAGLKFKISMAAIERFKNGIEKGRVKVIKKNLSAKKADKFTNN